MQTNHPHSNSTCSNNIQTWTNKIVFCFRPLSGKLALLNILSNLAVIHEEFPHFQLKEPTANCINTNIAIVEIRLIHFSFYCTYQPRHLTRVSQLYVKWCGTKERSVRANWATRLWITPLPSKINVKKIKNVKIRF